jgi:hypothetical protein
MTKHYIHVKVLWAFQWMSVLHLGLGTAAVGRADYSTPPVVPPVQEGTLPGIAQAPPGTALGPPGTAQVPLLLGSLEQVHTRGQMHNPWEEVVGSCLVLGNHPVLDSCLHRLGRTPCMHVARPIRCQSPMLPESQ